MYTIVSHDAGGAEIVSSYVRQRKLNGYFALSGPAVKIFERKIHKLNRLNIYEAIRLSKVVLCGTSWQAELEFEAIKYAKSLGKHTIAFLDHWTNYKERFIRKNELCLPDELLVGDPIAESMAKKIFPKTLIKLVKNPYLQDLDQELKALLPLNKIVSDEISVLYVCEPVCEHALKSYGDENYWGYTEEGALRYFLSNIKRLEKKIGRIVIRPHPSESIDKYSWAWKEFDLPIEMSRLSLIEEVASAEVVVGCQTMAMVVGLLANKQVISMIPPGGAACNLPQLEIMHL